MQAIAQRYTGEAAKIYKRAANNFRIPYWDWASNPAMPDIVNKPTLLITTPSGPKNVTNPLYAYRFPYLDPVLFPRNDDAGLSTFATTVRYPDTNGVSQPQVSNRLLLNQNFASQIVSNSKFEIGPELMFVVQSVHTWNNFPKLFNNVCVRLLTRSYPRYCSCACRWTHAIPAILILRSHLVRIRY
jgi:hypothetical protein